MKLMRTAKGDADLVLERVFTRAARSGADVRVRELPGREARFGKVEPPLSPATVDALRRKGIDRLYSHQAEAVTRIRGGEDVVIVTGTASGKTLCYTIPVLEAIEADPLATALLLFPTKALAQDQLRGLADLAGEGRFLAGTYDGDTPQALRRKLRDKGSVILTNPDMLHAGILPNHSRWGRFFSRLRYVVIDEVHAYRGVFGSHLANVLRRLRRACRHHGSEPVFVTCSATIGNPGEHAGRVTGVPMGLVDDDGSPRGPKKVVLLNPPPLVDGREGANCDPAAAKSGGDRKSALWEVVRLLAALVEAGVQTIAFTRTRLMAELVVKNTRELLRRVSRRLPEQVRGYRGGYLPEERREIEGQLARREILGVASTNALELGIDIGSLDACLILGYPGTIASLWQQAGRAGRKTEASLVVLVAQNSPIDQYLIAHEGWLFRMNPERAVVDPDNPHVTVGHLRCAAHELPVADEEVVMFGPLADAVFELLEEEGSIRRIDGKRYFAETGYPASEVSLRNIAGPVVTIQDEAAHGRVIGTLDEMSALSQLHDHAVYLHGGESWFVNALDLDQKIARVERRDLDYYTQAVQVAMIRIDETEEELARGAALAGFGEVTVTNTIPMFKKVRFGSRESVGFERLELPAQLLETAAMWFAPAEEDLEAVTTADLLAGEALIGLANVIVEVAPVFLMCDPSDIGAVVDSSQLGREAVFLYDRHPGGMGYARGALDRLEELLAAARDVIANCACEAGCPSCVGSASAPFAMSDLDSSVRDRLPDKRAAGLLAARLVQAGQLVQAGRSAGDGGRATTTPS